MALIAIAVAAIAGTLLVLMLTSKGVPTGTVDSGFQTHTTPQATPSASAVERVLDNYVLTARETEFFGPWKETRMDGARVAFQHDEHALTVLIGNFDEDNEQLTDVYLAQARAGAPLSGVGDEQKLDRHVGPGGEELARRFYLLATGPGEVPLLKADGVRDALLALSASVLEVGVFESGGVQLSVSAAGISASSVDSDVLAGVKLYKAVRQSLSVAG